MGTNYYAVQRKPSLSRKILHIGKASAGWKFAFQGYMNEEVTIKSLKDWKNYIKDNDMVILDEYDQIVSPDDFFKLVEDFQSNINQDNFTRDANIEGYRFYFGDFS